MNKSSLPRHKQGAWARLSTSWYHDPAIMRIAPDQRMGAWYLHSALTAYSRSDGVLSDGIVPAYMVPAVLAGTPVDVDAAIEALVSVGLMSIDGNGNLCLLDYHEWQQPASEVLAKKEQAAAAGRAGGLAKAAKAAGKAASTTPSDLLDSPVSDMPSNVVPMGNLSEGARLVNTAIGTTRTTDKYNPEVIEALVLTVDARLSIAGDLDRGAVLTAIESTLLHWKGTGAIGALFTSTLKYKVENVAKAAAAGTPPVGTVSQRRS